MFFHIFGLAFGAANLLSGNGVAEYIAKSSFVMPILSVLVLAIITNVVFTLQYVEELKKDNCDCSESVFRTMMYILSIISAITWGLVILLGIIVGGIILIDVNAHAQHSKAKKLKG